MNRGEDELVEQTNIALAKELCDALTRCDHKPNLVFSSSTHSLGDTAYGRSKKEASTILGEWARGAGSAFANLILPHVFGERGRPFYNSVVSTFCHQLAISETPEIHQDGSLELLHTQDVADLIVSAVEQDLAGDIRPDGVKISVSALLKKLEELSGSYRDGIIPDLRQEIDLQLFNTYRSYLFPAAYPMSLTLHTDDRGSLFEAVKSDHGGQAFMSSTKPGITRGEHFHCSKIERFLVMKGDATIRIRRLFDGHVHEFLVSGENPVYIDMPTLHTHNISNTGDRELLTLFWANEIFDPDRPDTFAEPVTDGTTSQ